MNSETEQSIRHNLALIQQRIDSACTSAGRSPDEVQLLLATKTIEPSRIALAISAGYPLIAENKIQELKDKAEALASVPHVNHFIGHLQSNKIKELLRYNVSCLQSLDRLSLAQKLQQRLTFENKTLDVMIQVNTSGEKSKFGVAPTDALDLIREVAQLDRLKITGLMTIGLFSAEAEKVRPCFRLLRNLRDEAAALELPGTDIRELSMGMSGDLETAIEEGATIIRVGTAIFGARPYPDSYYWNEKA